MCAIRNREPEPVLQMSPEINPDCPKKLGLALGFDSLLSMWAADSELVSDLYLAQCNLPGEQLKAIHRWQ